MSEQMPFNDDYDSNTSGNVEFLDLLNQHISRREFITKAAGGAVAITLATTLTGCNDDQSTNEINQDGVFDEQQTPKQLSFKTVDKNTLNAFTVPQGYEARVLFAMGDPMAMGMSEWDDHNVPSGASFTKRAGECHDGMTFFGMKNAQYAANESDEGLLVMNHEYINNAHLIHPAQNTVDQAIRGEDDVIREINAHGVSILHIHKNPTTQRVEINRDSPFNRRITAATPIDFSGPVKGNDLLKTAISPEGTFSLGTINNCGNGYTPWGTYLTTEENFNQYFSREDDARSENELVALARYKIPANSNYRWHTVENRLADADYQYDRWLTRKEIDLTASQDFRHSINTFGWIVEIDPFAANQRPVKRTALGRFAHEDCRASRAIAGQNLAFYMGDDSTGEYIYKFVSDTPWDTRDMNGGYTAGDKYMNHGKLYVAQFDFNEATQTATGQWLELSIHDPRIANYAKYRFADQGDVLVNARLAADAVGATKMDRPEWVAVHPQNGEVYVTLTNNTNRGRSYNTDAANPRHYFDHDSGSNALRGNINGHIIRLREEGDTTTATRFVWDIFLFGAEADALADVNLSGLSDTNDFSSPDGMWFDPRGVLWIQTDDSAYTNETNCMMLAALPGQVGDGKVMPAKSGDSTQVTPMGASLDDTQLRRFLTGPSGCEITGVTMTPDYKAIFVNVQHPGGTWPSNHPRELNLSQGIGTRPRSATVVITRQDGGVIAGEALEPQ